LLGKERNRWERWASGRVAKASWRKNKSGGDAELGRTWGFRIGGFWVKGFPFMAAAGLQRSLNQSGIWCRQHGARQWSAHEGSASWVRLQKKMAEWRHGVVRS
jgi:hypothetical protein